jgi:probable phosphoglycerate mutase
MRAVQTIDALRAQHPKQIIALFSHADLIKLVVSYYIGMHIDLFQRLVINPCSLTAISFERMGPRMMAYNDTGSLEHLRPKPEPSADGQAQPTDAPPAAGGAVQETQQNGNGVGEELAATEKAEADV